MIRLKTIAYILLLSLTACGVKGALQPKGKPEPKAPAAFSLQQQGNEILLRWEAPVTNHDGSKLIDLAGFRIDRYSYQPERYCPECRDQEAIATIRIDNPAPAIAQDGSYYYRDSGLSAETGYRYRVYPFTRSGKSGPAAQSLQIIYNWPIAPADIRVEELDQGARLFWTLPDTVQTRGEFIGINIYRGEIGLALNPEPVNLEPLKGNNFDNFGLKNGTTYRYGLRSVVKVDQTKVESDLSEIIDATPRAGR